MKIIKGDLIELAKQGHFDVIVHGCNCFCTFGKGIALQIKQEFPDAYEQDCKTTKGDKSKLGTYTYGNWYSNDENAHRVSIVNAYTQYGYWKEGDRTDLFEYVHFQTILDSLSKLLSKTHHIGFPLIGCGLAGGNRDVIMKMITDTFDGFDVTVVEWGGK